MITWKVPVILAKINPLTLAAQLPMQASYFRDIAFICFL